MPLGDLHERLVAAAAKNECQIPTHNQQPRRLELMLHALLSQVMERPLLSV